MKSSEKILIAADHAAVDLKKAIVESLKNYTFEDLGPNDTTSVDYPDYAEKLASRISNGEAKRGILLCGSGIGMSIAANKFPGVRAALVHSTETARLSRMHNDANVLCLGSRVLKTELAVECAKVWLDTDFSTEARHQGRVDKITQIEGKHCR